MTDVQLLDHFVSTNDESSFDALVARHGPRVLRVCQASLSDPHDVDDAYQATFLVLLKKASLIEDPGALGNWLHGVARRVAIRIRRDAARRRKHERGWAEALPTVPKAARPWDDLGRTVREELSRLPETYRTPLELCYLRGRTHEQAASELGWPLGTVKTRIDRGRRRLQDRLDRRGISVGIGLSLLLLTRREGVAADSVRPDGLPGPAGPIDHPEASEVDPPPPPSPSIHAPVLSLVSARRAKRLWGVLLALMSLLVAAWVLGFFTQVEPVC